MIYLDHNATTPMAPEAVAAMLPLCGRDFANPSSAHEAGRRAAEAVRQARLGVARSLGAAVDEIVFTPGGSAANNLALLGAFAVKGAGHLVTTAVEHPSVLAAARRLEQAGASLTVLPVDGEGFVDPADVEKALRPDTVLVSVMTAQNETGTLQPVEEVGRLLTDRDVLFHSDAVQAVGKLPVEVRALRADLVSVAAHKFNGPKGVGALYVRRGTRLGSLVYGGGQEEGLVAGTTNVPGVAAMARALALRLDTMEETVPRLAALRDGLEAFLAGRPGGLRVLGSRERRLPNTLYVLFEGVENPALLRALDARGLCVSGGSACHDGSGSGSPVLEAMGVRQAGATVRFSLGPGNTEDEISRAAAIVADEVERLRSGG